MYVEQLKIELVSLQEKVFFLQQDKVFYQYVMVLEISQDGFFIDGFEIIVFVGNNYFKGLMVLFQQCVVNVVVKGILQLEIMGSQNGKYIVLQLLKDVFLLEGDIVFGFKYFQVVIFYLQLLDGFVLEMLCFYILVYQYNCKCGDYECEYNWLDVLIVIFQDIM